MDFLQNMTNLRNKITNRIAQLDKRSLPLLLYSSLGILIFFILLITFNTHVLHLKVETAVISTPLEAMNAPITGFIAEIYVKPGDIVHKGTPLIRIENVELARDYEMARVNWEDAKLNISYYESLLQNEQQRLTLFKHVGSSRVVSAHALVQTAKTEFEIAKKNLARMQSLHNKHYLSDADFDSIKAKFHTADDKLKTAVAQEELEDQSLQSVDNGMYFTGSKLEGKEKDLSTEIEAARKRVQLQYERVKIFETLVNKLVLNAPFEAKVTQVLRTVGNTADTTKPLLLLEQIDTSKLVTAYLTQTEIAHLKLNSLAKIYIPALGYTLLGKVISINRTAGFVDEIQSQFRWRDLYTDRTATVTIELDPANKASYLNSLAAGMPAIVYFNRKINIF